ncbi:MAG: apolipoprotein N-acyltransferase, partial [Acidimicrobiales bacterium]
MLRFVQAVFRRERLLDLAAVATGVVTAFALPPWGWWPLAFVGLIGFDRLIADADRWARFRRGLLVGLGLYVPSLAWMLDLTAPGYVIAAAFYSALLAVAAVLVPAAAPGRWLALPGAIALTELLRWSWPFGGVPLSSLAVGQVASPLAPVLRIGGALLLVEVAVIVGVALAAALNRRWVAAGVGAAVALGIVLAGVAGPRGEQVGTLRVALVQGGGPQGTRASDTDERVVFE